MAEEFKFGQSMFVSGITQLGGGRESATATANPSGRLADDAWRRWVAENLLLRREPESIVQAMVRDGFDRVTAVREVQTALDHPYLAAAAKLGTGAGAPAADGGSSDNKVKKRDWVLELYRRSARQSSQFGKVPRVHRPSRSEFLEAYYAANRPVVITGAMDDWPAMTRWTPDYFKKLLGDRIVEVQANRQSDQSYEINQAKLKKQMKFGEYVDLVESVGETNNYYITANNTGINKAALLELWDDIVLFPEYLKTDDKQNNGFFWFGPKGTVTPLHHDLTNNFMAQVRGRKLVRLIAPYELPYMYNHRHCFTPVDLDNVDYNKFPEFKNVTVVDVVLEPGEVLFLPIGWWHYVRGLDISITMTFINFVFDNDFYSFYKTYEAI